jgi:hypothetical protein
VQNFWEDQNMCASKQAKGASAVWENLESN